MILKNNEQVLVALDQGTTSSRAVVFDLHGHALSSHAIEFPQIYPKPGWVEHNPEDILNTQIAALQQAVRLSQIPVENIAAIGITNQRETTMLWDRNTGKCVHNAIVWQCRRTASYIDKLVKQGLKKKITDITGLVPDAYFSGTKIAYILDELNLRDKAKKGELCFGTVDTFLAWNLVEGRPHVTDATNASRTMLYDINKGKWSDDMLHMLNIPRSVLPDIVDSNQIIGNLRSEILGRPIPVASMAGDQHAALFGQTCFEPCMVKNTYGTGCFMLMNTGDTPVKSQHGLLSTVAWQINGKRTYALEGSVFMGGATIQWLRDEMKLIQTSAESEAIANSVSSTNGVYLVPAFTGLGAPYWDMYSRGTLVGMTRGTNRAHIVRAALEAICYQSYDLLQAMTSDLCKAPVEMRVDGGASANGFLMQYQADTMNLKIIRPKIVETTALGAAMLAGLGSGIYKSLDDIKAVYEPDLTFVPAMKTDERTKAISGWHRAVERSLNWIQDN